MESIFKIIAQGFVIHKNSYLRDPWNRLDFVVVCFSLIDFLPAANYSFLKVFRSLRILRPLRSINKIRRMKLLINAMIRSVPGLATVAFFLFFVLSIFAIFGVNQFMGTQYKHCRATLEPIKNPNFISGVNDGYIAWDRLD